MNYTSKRVVIVNRETRRYVWSRDNGLCVYCGDLGQQIDHVVPITQSGPNIRGNMVLACRKCNVEKGNSVEERWIIPAFQHLAKVGESLEWSLRKFAAPDDPGSGRELARIDQEPRSGTGVDPTPPGLPERPAGR